MWEALSEPFLRERQSTHRIWTQYTRNITSIPMRTPAVQGKHGADEPAEMAPGRSTHNVSQVLLPRFYLTCLSFQSHSLFKREKQNKIKQQSCTNPVLLGQAYMRKTLCGIQALHEDKGQQLDFKPCHQFIGQSRQNGSPIS